MRGWAIHRESLKRQLILLLQIMILSLFQSHPIPSFRIAFHWLSLTPSQHQVRKDREKRPFLATPYLHYIPLVQLPSLLEAWMAVRAFH